MTDERRDSEIANGTEADIEGKPCIYYDGYWVRRYNTRSDSLANRKRLIDQLTRRVFHHTEPGINTPGVKLDLAREAYEQAQDPRRKRVNAAMLAGALLNRASDIFTKIVELQDAGVEIEPGNELLRVCGRYFLEALELGKQVKHYSGEEGLDELWGEPLKAFSMPVEQFYEGRYVKIAQTMRNLDRIAETMVATVAGDAVLEGFVGRIQLFAEAAKLESETLRSDRVIFEVWPEFVAAGDELAQHEPALDPRFSADTRRLYEDGIKLMRRGKDLMTWIASARVPMPKSTDNFIQDCESYRLRLRSQGPERLNRAATA